MIPSFFLMALLSCGLTLVQPVDAEGDVLNQEQIVERNAGWTLSVDQLLEAYFKLLQRTRELENLVGTLMTRVAFTVTNPTQTVASGSDVTLKYATVITKLGANYDPTTGIFTVVTPGVYFFTFFFHTRSRKDGAPDGLELQVNGNEKVKSVDITSGGDYMDSAGQGLILNLDKDDLVKVVLKKDMCISYDPDHFLNTFTGFLIQPSLAPEPPPGVEMSEADKAKAYIVNRHNELRRGVTPTASNMLKMSWSEEAAANAQTWADASQCLLKHSDPADRTISTSGCGENIAMGHSHTESSWADKIQMWYDEVEGWEYGEGPVDGADVGHFTQVVWYRSNLIGCAVAHCPDAEYKYIYVCQYCPPGNYQYTHPYKDGASCGDCPNHCDDKLCTNPCPYTDKWNNCDSDTAWKCENTESCEATCKCTSGEII